MDRERKERREGPPPRPPQDVPPFDPDYDLDGSYAREVVGTLVAGLSPLLTGDPRPDRADIA